MEYYEITISETARDNLKQSPYFFNREIIRCTSINEVREKLSKKYGNIPKGRTKVYRDRPNGESIEIGITHSFWNRDFSHNSKPWYQTDWIEIEKVTEKREPIKL